ncbi:flagellar protein FliT [Halomonas sp. WWR20]
MQTSTELLSLYEGLLTQSQAMLESARRQEWDQLIQQKSRYIVDVERLQSMESNCSLDDEARVIKMDLLVGILENDGEIRRYLEARRDELSDMLGNSRRQRALSQAYNQGQGNMSSRIRARHEGHS